MKFYFFFLCIPLFVFAKNPYEINRQKLELLSREIASDIRVYNETLQKEHKTISDLNTIEFELHNSSLEIQKREKQKMVLEKEIDVLKKKQESLEKELLEKNKLLEKRLPVLGQFGNLGYLDVLL
jgi:septal ring factor EnvC (AmiA/AmiB activator)